MKLFLLVFLFLSGVAFAQERKNFELDIPERLRVEKLLKNLDILPPTQKKLFENLLVTLPPDVAEKVLSIASELPPDALFRFVSILLSVRTDEIPRILAELEELPLEGKLARIRQRELILEVRELSPVEIFYSKLEGVEKVLPRLVGYDIIWRATNIRVAPSLDYIIAPGDEVFVYAWGEGIAALGIGFPVRVTVLPDGKIFLPQVGPVAVAGMTVAQVQEILKKILARTFGSVDVSVSVSSTRAIPIVVMGEVERPGVVMLYGNPTPFDAIAGAGGIKRTGSLRHIRIIRRGRKIAEIDLYELIFKGKSPENIRLTDWDVVFVPPVSSTYLIEGAVLREGIYEMKGKMTVGEAVELAGGTVPSRGKFRVIVKRYAGDSQVKVFDVSTEFPTKITFRIEPYDRITVSPQIWERTERFVLISGYVRKTGRYVWREGMTVKDLVFLAGGFPDVFPPSGFELSRKDGKKISVVFDGRFDDSKLEVELLPFDSVLVYPPPYTARVRLLGVRVEGEVKRPGEYFLPEGARVSDLIRVAGGFTKYAFPEGAVFLRNSVARAQKEKIALARNLLLRTMITEVGQISVPGIAPEEQVKLRRQLAEERLALLKILEIPLLMGRISIRLTRNLDEFEKSPDNIELEDGDRLFIPRFPNWVMVSGEVKNPATFVWVEGRDAEWYIELAGGMTNYADDDGIYIIRANGIAVTDTDDVRPGDTIIVPPKITIPISSWYFIRDALSLSFQGISAAALMFSAIAR